MDGEIIIVDEFTGRLMPGRNWSDGLHQAVEAKEGVRVKEENQTLATITLQNFFKLYDKICGMTGTAMTEASRILEDLQARRDRRADEQADAAAQSSRRDLSAPSAKSTRPSPKKSSTPHAGTSSN